MNFIKIVLRTGKEFSLPEEKVLAILTSEEQLVRVHKKGVWTGMTINKADISWTEFDAEETKRWNRDNGLKLPEPEEDQLTKKEIRQRLNEIGTKFTHR